MSIVRVGLSETKKFGDGYDAIFAKKSRATAKAKSAPKKKPVKKK
jgi:hypothetical protein